MVANISHDATEVIAWTTKCIANFNATQFENSVEQFAQEHHASYTTFAILAIILGSFFLLFGYSLFYLTLAVVGFILGAAVGFFLLCGATAEIIAAGIGGAVGGVLLGLMVVKLEKLGVAAMGIAGGLVAALYTNGFVMHYLYEQFSDLHQSWMPYVYAGILAVIGCFLALKLERIIIIIVTAFGGAYALGWGIIRLAWRSEHAGLGPLFLFSGQGCGDSFCKIALLCILGVGTLGMIFQLYRTSENRFSKKCSRDVVQLNDSQDANTVLLVHDEKLLIRGGHMSQV